MRSVRVSSRAGAVALIASALVAPAVASAATITVDRGCYDSQPGGDQVTARAEGFAPGHLISFAVGTVSSALARADESGTAVATFGAPPLPGLAPGAATSSLTATDTDGSPERASTTIAISRLDELATPLTQSLRRILTFSFSGFPAGSTLYAHYLLGRRLLLTRILGAVQGPCGLLTVRGRRLPLPDLRVATYTIQWDTSARYRPDVRPRLAEKVFVLAKP